MKIICKISDDKYLKELNDIAEINMKEINDKKAFLLKQADDLKELIEKRRDEFWDKAEAYLKDKKLIEKNYERGGDYKLSVEDDHIILNERMSDLEKFMKELNLSM